MERDQQLKKILLNSAESASADFTDAVMQKIHGLEATSMYYKPLVSPKLKKIFLITYGALIAGILGICLISALINFEALGWIQNMEIPEINYSRILMFIIIFWVLFTTYRLLEKKFLLRKDSYFQIN